MVELGRRGRSLICTEARTHTVARAGGRWVSAQAWGHAARARGARLRHGLVRGDVRVDHARGAGKRGRLARSDYA
jgi:hypothetical protein